jgi:multiple sugar transport system permease protein
MAGASIAAIPVVGLFVFLQRYFLQGVTLGALKG